MRPLVTLVLLLCGCGGRPVSVDARTDAGPSDAVLSDARARDACPCASHQVLLGGPCVPTDRLSTCGTSCDPSATIPCAGPQYCEACAGSPPCGGAGCRAACVPEPDFRWSPGALRLAPTVAKVGQPVKLTIEGCLIYWGSGWSLRLGTGAPIQLAHASALTCTITATVTPPAPGAYPVEIAYGWGSPGSIWSLAGFLVAVAGDTPPIWIQPGRPCSGSYPCASAAPYTCACQGGRCACK